MNLPLFRIIILVLAGGLVGCQDGSSDSPFSDQLLDQEGLFSETERQELVEVIDSLETTSGLDLMVVTVENPGQEGLLNYAAYQKNKLRIGEEGLNNGGIILLSVAGREVKVEIDFGLEWMVSDTISGDITKGMTEDLAAGNYLDALTTGLSDIAGFSNPEDWIAPAGVWNWSDSLKIGQLVQIKGKCIGRSYQEGVPSTSQFHPNYYIEVENPTDPDQVIFLLFSRYMQDMVDLLVYGNPPPSFVGRVTGLNPVTIALTGTIVPDA